jgi:hypothetical protein
LVDDPSNATAKKIAGSFVLPIDIEKLGGLWRLVNHVVSLYSREPWGEPFTCRVIVVL